MVKIAQVWSHGGGTVVMAAWQLTYGPNSIVSVIPRLHAIQACRKESKSRSNSFFLTAIAKIILAKITGNCF